MISLTPVLTVEQLSLTRGERPLFQNLHFTLNAGEVLQIVGPNGSGKSSLIDCLLGLLPQASGEILWHGDPKPCHIGHQSAIKPMFTALENLQLNTFERMITPAEASAALAAVGLSAFADQLCGHLSRGQCQRVALARLYLSDATVWVLDEPFTALDSESFLALRDLMIQKLKAGMSIIFTSHRDVSMEDYPILHIDLSAYQVEAAR